MPFEIYELGIQRTNLYWGDLDVSIVANHFIGLASVGSVCKVTGAAIELNDVNVWERNKWSLFKTNHLTCIRFISIKQHVHFSFLCGGNKIEFFFAKLKKWEMKNESLCSVVIFSKTDKWQIKICIQFSFFSMKANYDNSIFFFTARKRYFVPTSHKW